MKSIYGYIITVFLVVLAIACCQELQAGGSFGGARGGGSFGGGRSSFSRSSSFGGARSFSSGRSSVFGGNRSSGQATITRPSITRVAPAPIPRAPSVPSSVEHHYYGSPSGGGFWQNFWMYQAIFGRPQVVVASSQGAVQADGATAIIAAQPQHGFFYYFFMTVLWIGILGAVAYGVRKLFFQLD